jgi:hypothetical protein
MNAGKKEMGMGMPKEQVKASYLFSLVPPALTRGS